MHYCQWNVVVLPNMTITATSYIQDTYITANQTAAFQGTSQHVHRGQLVLKYQLQFLEEEPPIDVYFVIRVMFSPACQEHGHAAKEDITENHDISAQYTSDINIFTYFQFSNHGLVGDAATFHTTFLNVEFVIPTTILVTILALEVRLVIFI